jgi:hypothetical protein
VAGTGLALSEGSQTCPSHTGTGTLPCLTTGSSREREGAAVRSREAAGIHREEVRVPYKQYPKIPRVWAPWYPGYHEVRGARVRARERERDRDRVCCR